jgi:3-oxoacyl-[acyl-carrier protein] reductase
MTEVETGGGALHGRVVVVTGAARGLGRQYADLVATDGGTVVVADIDGAGAEAAAKELRAGGSRAIGVTVDVTDEASTQAMAKAAADEFGGVDVLVNNAAVWGDLEMGPVLTSSVAHWDLVMAVNVKGPLLCARAVVPLMQARGRGRIINISSMGAYLPGGVYPVSKLALNQLTYQLAVELGGAGITVNAVAPGSIDNEATRRHVPPERLAALVAQQPVKRPGTAEDIYGAIRYLASDAAEWVTGQTILVNGGFNTRF